jgi:hypothetical protein
MLATPLVIGIFHGIEQHNITPATALAAKAPVWRYLLFGPGDTLDYRQ